MGMGLGTGRGMEIESTPSPRRWQYNLSSITVLPKTLKLAVYIDTVASSRTCSCRSVGDTQWPRNVARGGKLGLQFQGSRCCHLIIAGTQGRGSCSPRIRMVCHPQVRRQADQTHDQWKQAIMIVPNSPNTSNDASLKMQRKRIIYGAPEKVFFQPRAFTPLALGRLSTGSPLFL